MDHLGDGRGEKGVDHPPWFNVTIVSPLVGGVVVIVGGRRAMCGGGGVHAFGDCFNGRVDGTRFAFVNDRGELKQEFRNIQIKDTFIPDAGFSFQRLAEGLFSSSDLGFRKCVEEFWVC